MAYLFTYAGAPSKTQERTRQILNEMYSDRPDGLSGNEDCGQMSAWYVMSAMGFYQVAPGNPEYVLSSPIFDSVTITLENKKRFVISAERNAPSNLYIQSATKNGNEMKELFFSHNDILNGATIRLSLGATPSKRFDEKKKMAVNATRSLPFLTLSRRDCRSKIQQALRSIQPKRIQHCFIPPMAQHHQPHRYAISSRSLSKTVPPCEPLRSATISTAL
jgi:hypothetical protein